MNRFSAFAVHMAISLAIFAVLAYFVIFEWYPGLFFDTDGGWRGMRIIIAVDLILGPTLTLIVFKPGKPGLKMDLTLIGILQAVCLTAGTYVVYSERPVAVAYTEGRFTVMTTDDYREADIPNPNLSHFPGDDPKWVMVALPEDAAAAGAIRYELFQSGRLLNTATDLYVPFDATTSTFLEEAALPDVVLAQGSWQERVDVWLNENGGSFADYAFFTFSTRYVFGYLIYDRATRERVGIVMATPDETG